MEFSGQRDKGTGEFVVIVIVMGQENCVSNCVRIQYSKGTGELEFAKARRLASIVP